MHNYSAAVLIVDDQVIKDKYIPSLAKFSEHKPLIKVSISDAGVENSVGEIHFTDQLKLDKTKMKNTLHQILFDTMHILLYEARLERKLVI